MTSRHTLKFAGFNNPQGHEDVDILTLRKAKYLRFTERMLKYPPKIGPTSQNPMPTDKYETIINSANSGLIPWPFKSETPDEYIKRWKEKNMENHKSDSGFRKVKSRPWGEYFYTCFFGLAPKLIMMDEDTLMKKREDLYEEVDVSGLPPDGSKGQARTSRKNKRCTIDWFIGQWDGHYTDWEETVTVSERMAK